MLGKTISSILLADNAITNIINNRLYPMSSKAQGLPSIYYNVSGTPHYNNNGQQMTDWTVEILTMCKEYSDAWDLAKLIFRAMHKKRRRKVGTVKINEIQCTGIRDDYEFNINSHGNILTFEITTNNLI